MLETEEVDDDFFTPVTNTTLAGIFGNSSEDRAQASLKYMAPKPQENINESVENKQTHCVFACALVGYEWFNNVYTPKGKLGFAIVKFDNSESKAHSIVLYDANKTTLSTAAVTNNFKIIIKKNRYISYYDNLKKYWSLYGTEDEVKKIAKTLKDINATIEYDLDTEKGPCKMDSLKSEEVVQPDRASDTDTSVQNKKTKMSILNRMASMGQSVLPQPHNIKSSSSSESNDDSSPLPKYRPTKKTLKIHTQDKNISDTVSTFESHRKETLLSHNTLYSYINGQLVPVIQNDIVNTSPKESKDMNLFIYEQRMNNSELRINISRMADKVDQLVDKVKDLGTPSQSSSSSSNYHYEILQKLLVEYENKIKAYEEQIKSMRSNTINTSPQIHKVTGYDSDEQANKIIILEDTVNEKDNEIYQLHEELKNQKLKFEQEIDRIRETERKHVTEMIELRQDLSKSKDSFDTQNPTHGNTLIENKIKKIMNDTFKGISVNFEDSESYSGETVKHIVVSVIKNVTIESLK